MMKNELKNGEVEKEAEAKVTKAQFEAFLATKLGVRIPKEDYSSYVISDGNRKVELANYTETIKVDRAALLFLLETTYRKGQVNAALEVTE